MDRHAKWDVLWVDVRMNLKEEAPQGLEDEKKVLIYDIFKYRYIEKKNCIEIGLWGRIFNYSQSFIKNNNIDK